MNGELLYLAWLSAGTPLPLSVCDALAGCMVYWANHKLPNHGRFAIHVDESGEPLCLDSGQYVILHDGAPQPLTDQSIDALKAYARKHAADPGGQITPIRRMLHDPEARAWAGVP